MSLIQNHMMSSDEGVALPVLIQSRNVGANPGNDAYVYNFSTIPTDGDLMILISGTAQNKTQSISGGWTQLFTTGGFIYGWWKIANAEPVNYTITVGGSFNATAWGMTFRGYNPLNPVTNTGAVNTVGITSVTFPASPITIKKYSYVMVADSHAIATLNSYSNSFVAMLTASRLHVGKREYTDTEYNQNVTLVYASSISHNGSMFYVNPALK